ncbi:MAG: amidohydrolase family protein [Promethearchaeota archaeon]
MSVLPEDFKYIDAHCHFFPPQIMKSIWKFFEKCDEKGNVTQWPINYKLKPENCVKFLHEHQVDAFTTYNYAHKAGIAEFINEWINEFVKIHQNAIPFGCVWPEDDNRIDYINKIFEKYNFKGIKIQLLVQNFYPADERMDCIYDLILDKGKWICFHVGTAPYPNKYVGYKHFIKFLKKYPDINIIVAHMGAFEYKKFMNLLDLHENLYLDTTMIYIPNNIFPERKSKRPKEEELITYQDRILYGSDFPNIPYDYQCSREGLLKMDLPREVYEKIFYKNAKRIFDLH